MNSLAPLRAGRREWLGLAVLVLPALLVSMDLTVLYLAVPKLTADLSPSSAQLLWITDIYGFLIAGSLITMGTLGDRIGRRKLLMAGAAVFGLASMIAAFATSAEMLIAARALLGVAGATLAPSTLSLIRNMFHDPQQRTVAIGVWIMGFSSGGALGPVLGGVLLEYFWWGSVFLLNVPVMVLLLVLAPILLPEYRDTEAGHLDLPSAALSLLGVLAVIFGLKQIAEDGIAALPLISIALGAVIFTTFLRRQRTLADPLIDLQLFRVPAFSASLATNTLGIFAAFGIFFFTAQYLQLVEGMSPLRAGFWSLPSSVGFIVGASVAPMIVRRVRAAYVVAGGLGLASLGFAILTQISVGSGVWLLIAGSIVFSLGLAPVFTLTTDLIIGSAPPERAGAAGAVSETGSELGGALGIAILGSIGAAIYRGEIGDTMPEGVPASSTESARDTLGGAVAESELLPAPVSAELLDAAREAFVQAMQVSAAISGVIMLATAVLAATLLRNVRPGGEPAEQQEPERERPAMLPDAVIPEEPAA
jgi:DHA2 family multidrug resistance protein-like MFS transporter